MEFKYTYDNIFPDVKTRGCYIKRGARFRENTVHILLSIHKYMYIK